MINKREVSPHAKREHTQTRRQNLQLNNCFMSIKKFGYSNIQRKYIRLFEKIKYSADNTKRFDYILFYRLSVSHNETINDGYKSLQEMTNMIIKCILYGAAMPLKMIYIIQDNYIRFFKCLKRLKRKEATPVGRIARLCVDCAESGN